MPLPVSSKMTIKSILCFPEIIIYSKAMPAHVAQCNYCYRSLDRCFIGHVIDEYTKWILNEWDKIQFNFIVLIFVVACVFLFVSFNRLWLFCVKNTNTFA